MTRQFACIERLAAPGVVPPSPGVGTTASREVRRRRKRAGTFTMIELLVVVTIIAILTARG